jgi:YVTN family beta-propeller protein
MLEDRPPTGSSRLSIVLAATALIATACAGPRPVPVDVTSAAARLATGQSITPGAVGRALLQPLNPGLARYPNFVAGEAVKSQLSPDGTTLAVLCAGMNSLVGADGKVDAAHSTQYIFLYDVAGENRLRPALRQVIPQPNAYVGMAFAPDGSALYVAGGSDDAVYVYTRPLHAWALAAKIELGHGDKGLGIDVRPNAGGLALSADGRTLMVANNYNDSVSIIDTGTRRVRYEHDLRPYNAANENRPGGVGGTFPFAVAIQGNSIAYVSSDRDREVIALDISSPRGARLIRRIPLDGNALGMTLDPARSRLYVAQDNADEVAVIDTKTETVIARIDARAPAGLLAGARFTGAATYAVTLAPDGKTLYAVNSGANSIAVIPLDGPQALAVAGLIPTGYEPHDVTFSADGGAMYIVNGKSATGPNPRHLSGSTARLTQQVGDSGDNMAALRASRAANQYQFQLERATLVSAPVPARSELPALTAQVARNNFYAAALDAHSAAVMAFLRAHIQHVIYVIKENRTFDQVLGDLGNGSDGDPAYTQFGAAMTPNFHAMAPEFVTIDHFSDPGDGSMDGWSWALQGRVTNAEALTQQIAYAFVDRGLSYESEGESRGVAVNWPGVQERDAAAGAPGTKRFTEATATLPGGTANVLAGSGDHASADAPYGPQRGSIAHAVLAAGKTVRNYGVRVQSIGTIGTKAEPLTDPFGAGRVQVVARDPELAPYTDLYFRGFDQNYPDLWRFDEWKREFDDFGARGDLPALSLVRLAHDHMGAFDTALAGVNTPETQQADNDLALGKLVEAVAASRFAQDTLIFIAEDDGQDGPDHVDSHRTPIYVVGPYVRRGAVVHTAYSQVNLLRTIEDLLGTQHMNLNTACQPPMADLFDPAAAAQWRYVAVGSTLLKTTELPRGRRDLRFVAGADRGPAHDAAYWQAATAGMDFSHADRVPRERFNHVLWTGLMGERPYPAPAKAVSVERREPVDDDDDD